MSNPEELRAEIEKVKKRLDRYVDKTTTILQDLQHELRKVCDHQDVEEYKWEWDSGYGQQKWITGLKCTFCKSRKAWSRVGYWSTK